MSYRVGIIAAPSSPEVIGRLAAKMPLWVITSGDNRAAVEAIWETRPTPDLERGIAIFTSPPRLETHKDWESLLDWIELHHGEYSHHPPVDELEVIGARASDPIRRALAEFGYLEVSPTEDGFVARKPIFGH